MTNRPHAGIVLSILVLAGLLFADSVQAAPPAKVAPLMKDFMGINVHTVQFKAELFAPTCRLVRDYHPFNWDTGGDTSADTTFPLTREVINWKDDSGLFRDFSGQVNWKDLYIGWQRNGFEINASIMLPVLEPDTWKDLDAEAYKYGKAFAEYFGPSGAQKLVTSAEIGNEPDSYDDATYRKLFEAMARGMREGDPKLLIATSASSARETYTNRRALSCVKGFESLYDVINIHTYAHSDEHPNRWPYYHRSYPEDPNIRYLKDTRDITAWRDANAPGKQLWVTEFGWDAAARPATESGMHSKWLDVSDEHQAEYIVRGFLIFSAMGIDRAYLYWFNDSDVPSVHAASGITRFNRPKPSYYAMAHLYKSLGDYRFNRAVQQDEGELYIYEYVHGENSKEVVWVAWVPTDTRMKVEKTIALPTAPYRVDRMPMTGDEIDPTKHTFENGQITVEINGSPLYMWMKTE